MQIWAKQDTDESLILATAEKVSGTFVCGGSERFVEHLDRGVYRVTTRCRFVVGDLIFEPTPGVMLTVNRDFFVVQPDVDIPRALEALGVEDEAAAILKAAEEPRLKSLEEMASSMKKKTEDKSQSKIMDILNKVLWGVCAFVGVFIGIAIAGLIQRRRVSRRKAARRNESNGDGNDLPLVDNPNAGSGSGSGGVVVPNPSR